MSDTKRLRKRNKYQSCAMKRQSNTATGVSSITNGEYRIS